MENTVYKNKNISLVLGNSLEIMKKIESETIDVIATDPPFFLSNGGITCQNGKMVSVDKGDWDKVSAIDMEKFYSIFLTEAKRVLKPNGTVWVFGTMHNIFLIGYLMQGMDFKILNNIAWQKTNPAPNLSCRMFTHSTENIIWAKKDKKTKHYFDYQYMKEMNGGKQMKDVWTSSTVKKSEKEFGKHPTQKPLEIMNKIILASTKENDLILDPFMGSGTTVLSAEMLNRKAIGIDQEVDFVNLAKKRILNYEDDKQLELF